MIKEIISLAALCVMLPSLCLGTISAKESEALPAGPCPLCLTGSVYHSDTTHGKWRTQYYIPCAHGDARIQDKYQERVIHLIDTCNSCEYGRESLTVQTRVVCRSKG